MRNATLPAMVFAADLEHLDAFIDANHAGAAAALADHGAAIRRAFGKARQAAAQAADPEACIRLMWRMYD